MPIAAMTAPANPATRNPMNATVITTGPGVIIATATASRNWCSFSQPNCWTTPWCKNGMMASPLPKTDALRWRYRRPRPAAAGWIFACHTSHDFCALRASMHEQSQCASRLSSPDQASPTTGDEAREIDLRPQHADAWRCHEITCTPVRGEFVLELAQSTKMVESFAKLPSDHDRPVRRPMPGAGRGHERGHAQIEDLETKRLRPSDQLDDQIVHGAAGRLRPHAHQIHKQLSGGVAKPHRHEGDESAVPPTGSHPKMTDVCWIEACHRKALLLAFARRAPRVRNPLQRFDGPGDTVFVQQRKRHSRVLSTPDRVPKRLMAVPLKGECAQPDARLLGNLEHSKVVTEIDRQIVWTHLMKNRPPAVGPDLMDEAVDQ